MSEASSIAEEQMNQPRYGKRAPTEEAHQSALQLRKNLFAALEAAMDNDWARVETACRTVTELARHCRIQEAGFDSTSVKKAWAEGRDDRLNP